MRGRLGHFHYDSFYSNLYDLSGNGWIYEFVVNSRQQAYYIRKQRTVNFYFIVFLTCSTQQESGSLFHFWCFIVIRGSSFFHLASNIRCYDQSDRDLLTYSFYEKYNSCSVIEFIFIEIRRELAGLESQTIHILLLNQLLINCH